MRELRGRKERGKGKRKKRKEERGKRKEERGKRKEERGKRKEEKKKEPFSSPIIRERIKTSIGSSEKFVEKA